MKKTFKYLQSIYSNYKDREDIILFPLFFSIEFTKEKKPYLKADITAIIEHYKKNYFQDKELLESIDSSIMDLFLSEINLLIYKMKNKKEILPIYKH